MLNLQSLLTDAVFLNTIAASPLQREEESYFTFSPFQDTDKNFIEKSIFGLSIKRQVTLRYINSLDLTNPLALNLQDTVAIQDYQITNQSFNIIKIIKKISSIYKLNEDSIILEMPLGTESSYRCLNNFFGQVNFKENLVANLPLGGEHKYIRVRYLWKGGTVVIGRFVLVNILVNGDAQLDSIFYPERLNMIFENKNYIFEQEKYSLIVTQLRKYDSLTSVSIHIVMNHLLVIVKMAEMKIRPSAKGVGNEMRRKIKSLLIFDHYYLDSQLDLFKYFKLVNRYLFYNKVSLESVFTEISASTNRINKSISQLDKSSIDSLENYISTYGVPREEFGFRMKVDVSEYMFKGESENGWIFKKHS